MPYIIKNSFQFSVFSFRLKDLSGKFSAAENYFLPFLGAAGFSSLHMQAVSPQMWHFLGLQRVSMVAPHFSHLNTAIFPS